MFFYEGMKCPVCEKEFQAGDDIVACPQCGAPHHRECWMQAGQCHFAALHGTPDQWSREQAVAAAKEDEADKTQSDTQEKLCPRCGAHNTEYAEFCSNCGNPLEAEDWADEEPPHTSAPYRTPGGIPYGAPPFYAPMPDPYGGIPKTEHIDGETVEDVAASVGGNTTYYIPRFFEMARSRRKVSWNWPAFLLTPYWLMFRKSYLCGLLTLAFEMLYTFITNFIVFRLMETFPPPTGTDPSAFSEYIFTLADNPNTALWVEIIGLLALARIAVHVLFGLFGNYLYMHTALDRIRRLRAKAPESYKVQLPAVGGVSVLLGMIAYMAVETSLLLVQMLFGLIG